MRNLLYCARQQTPTVTLHTGERDRCRNLLCYQGDSPSPRIFTGIKQNSAKPAGHKVSQIVAISQEMKVLAENHVAVMVVKEPRLWDTRAKGRVIASNSASTNKLDPACDSRVEPSKRRLPGYSWLWGALPFSR